MERSIQLTPEVEKALREAIDAFNQRPDQRLERPVAHGTRPVDATPAKLVFESQYDPAALAPPSQAPPGEKGGVDHYARRQFHPVRAGAHIGRIVPAGAGQDGSDVTGKAVPARQAPAREVRIDETIVRGPDGTLVAATDGILDWREPNLRVSHELVIDGYVDFSTGHIDFPGSVVINKGVRDQFRVTAAGSITVAGLVESAQIQAGRDLNLNGGMASRERASAEAHRDIRARYLDNVTVNAWRDLVIENEAIGCNIRVGRACLSPKAAIAGGLIECARELELGTLGSEACVPTRVRIGVLPELEALIERSQSLLPQLEARAAKAEAALAQLKSVSGKLAPQQAESLTELEFALQQARAKRLPILQAIDTLKTTLRQRTIARLTVHSTIHPGVRIELGTRAFEITSPVTGPVAIEASADGEIIARDAQRRALEIHSFTRIVRLTPAPVPA
jgi:uncharacterized protein (DUF342 family)